MNDADLYNGLGQKEEHIVFNDEIITWNIKTGEVYEVTGNDI